MAAPEPTWQLILDSARRLASDQHTTDFRLAELVEEVRRIDPTRGPTSIRPVVQGMTVNAGKGPPSPCGMVLRRVAHGRYQLLTSGQARTRSGNAGAPRASTPTSRTRRNPRGRSRILSGTEVTARLAALQAGFDGFVEKYDATVPFTRKGQYEWHRRTIDRRRAHSSVEEAIDSREYVTALYEVLQAWGIGKRASRLVPIDQFRHRLVAAAPALRPLDQLSIRDPALDLPDVARQLNALITDLRVVENRALVVAGTKTLHHLLPELVPPMDRAWTGAFFGWQVLDPQNHQASIFNEAFIGLAKVARVVEPGRLVGDGWRTCTSKLLDNALVGYCKTHGIGG